MLLSIFRYCKMHKQKKRLHALADVASDWRDPDHPPRAAAREKTLEAPNRWTTQALTHAMNRWMQRLTVEGLTNWVGEEPLSTSQRVGVLHAETGPLAGVRDALAAWALGHDYIGCVPESSPAILPAFAEAVEEREPAFSIRFRDAGEDVYEEAQVLLAEAEESAESVQKACKDHGISPAHRLIRRPVYSVGVVDGNESEDEMERLAEDMLLFEGLGRRRIAILWAPEDHSPDDYLQAMARFRGLFPAHSDTPGTLQMQQAFLDAQDQPHAYADGLEFLVSRGDPEPQRPGHIRWAEYDSVDAIQTWLTHHEEDVYSFVARSGLHDQLPLEHPIRTPGGVHIPSLTDEEGCETVAFLRNVAN